MLLFSNMPAAIQGPRRLLSLRMCALRSAGPMRAAWMSSRTRQSLEKGSLEPPLLTTTIPEHFASIVSEHGDKNAISDRAPYLYSGSTSSFRPPPINTLTYAELDELSNRQAVALRGLGIIQKGDRVAVSLGSTIEHASLLHAVWKLGAVFVPLNPAFNTRQIAAAINHLGVKLLIMGAVTDLPYKPTKGRENWDTLYELAGAGDSATQPLGMATSTANSKLELGLGRNITSELMPSLKRIVVVDNSAYHPGAKMARSFQSHLHTTFSGYEALMREVVSAADARTRIVPDVPLNPSDVINTQFTSGTTAAPKAAQLTHVGILNNGHLIGKRLGLVPGDRIVVPPPLFHCFGSVLGFMATCTNAAEILFASPAFDPRATLTMLRETRAVGCYGVGTMFVALLELLADAQDQERAFHQATRSKDHDVSKGSSDPDFDEEVFLWARHPYTSHLRKGIASGSVVQQALMEKLRARLGFEELCICYGMTETSPVSLMTKPADPIDKRIGTVGRVMDHTMVRIVDPLDRSRVLPRGERGELATAGYLVMKGYYGDEAATNAVLFQETDANDVSDHGEQSPGRTWMHTGDEATMDDEGYVRITGRIKDLIIRGGENINPTEIENCLFQHPQVAEASVVAVTDHKLGEVVGAFVKPHHHVDVDDDLLDLENMAGQSINHSPFQSNTAAVEGHPDSMSAQNPSSSRSNPGLTSSIGAPVLTKAELRAWVRSCLSDHLVPKYVFWIKDYPKTSSAKIQKFKLREIANIIVHGKDK